MFMCFSCGINYCINFLWSNETSSYCTRSYITRRPDRTRGEIEVPELENGEIQTIQHVHT